ncbi:DUF3822 family protein [Arenibacter sp. GZD96]|uniref:DUF3822 family protein n=1 Tax=Aurantibrevibacter litoralis TaxID=3106030 RepID=UPI002AFF8A68|nr:DUF3822 family protein [Arenibacter sp. GZD-96]MEA1784916.1 DUF3822 family protein [Arenibacter sp. GZD-96]
MTKKEIFNKKGDFPSDYHKLSIQVSLSGLSFCVLDIIGNTILASENIRFEKELSPYEVQKTLKSLLEKNNIKKVSFSEIVVVHRNNLFSLVPKSLFDPKELANYLKFNTKILANDHLAYDEIENHDMMNVYIPFVNINNYIYDLFGEFDFVHNGTVLIQSLLNLPATTKDTICYVHVLENQMDITLIAGKKLVLYNSHNFETKDDFLYYILFTLEQLKLQPETTIVKLFGTIEEDDDIYTCCCAYLKQISIFIPTHTTYPLGSEDQDSIDFAVLNSL